MTQSEEKATQTEENAEPSKKSRLRRWLFRILIIGGCLFILGIATIAGILWYHSSSLPSFDSLADYNPPQVTRMYDRNGRVIAELYEEKRTVVTFDRIPLHVRKAFLAAEDADFYSHPGLDFMGMLRAMWHNIKAGRVVQGGSTITQQVIKTFLLGPERSYTRKIKELLLALRLESNLSKDEILSLYLNQIYFGHRCYGIQEAARYYFDCDVSGLSIEQSALLASLPKSPAGYSPINHPERAKQRRDWVLDQMLKNEMASVQEVKIAKSKELDVVGSYVDFFESAPYYAEYCRRVLEEKLGKDRLLQGGLRVELAVDLDLQQVAQQIVAAELRRIDRRHGYRGRLGKITAEQIKQLHDKHDSQGAKNKIWTLVLSSESQEPETASKTVPTAVKWLELKKEARVIVPVTEISIVDKTEVARLDLGISSATLDLKGIKWARKFSPVGRTPAPKKISDILEVGDLIEVRIEDPTPESLTAGLSQPPLVQGALISMDPHSKHVLALVGGSNFRDTPLIRAVQSRRQPGSSFKPIVYTAAIHTGAYTPASILMDTPEVYRSLQGKAWKPQNFERVFTGAVTLRYALAHSINTVAVKVCSDIGPPAVSNMARDLGIKSKLARNLSMALGSSEVTLLELTNAYSVFPGQGKQAEPVFITAVKTPDGKFIEGFEQTEPRQAISQAEAFIMTSLLRSVIENGTGKRALKLGRPLGGKTGTTNQQKDGWFVGFSADLVSGVWVGFDDNSSMGTGWAQGAGTALPIWVQFMEAALRDRPKLDFKASEGTVFVRIDPENGLLASPQLADAEFEVFVEGTEPRAVSDRLSGGDRQVTSSGSKQINSTTGKRLPEGMYR
ncbi:MAG: PBP1A family penicillin-binding protein [Deltaproteobacteria bacterium]|nr:PBP1A family penicillin-binding protein [Deltaproteobacteria bacterium]